MYALEVKNLERSYGVVKAVRGLSFAVNSGECFGLLGPNGAGKSTTIEMIEQIQKPDSGEIFYFGRKPDDKMRDELGVQFQETALLPSLTVRESLHIFSGLYSNPRGVDELIELCRLKDFADRRHDKLSGGQKQRLLLAIALSNHPKLLLLDEPTTGLDPQARRHLWDIISDIKKSGTTILLTTHYMDEAETLCDRIVIIDHGKIIAEGQPRRLIRTHLPEVVVEMPKIENLAKEAIDKISQLGRLDFIGDRMQISTKKLDLLVRLLTDENLSLEGLHVRQPNLEDLFLSLTGTGLRS